MTQTTPLAVVGKVIDLAAIEGADRIRCATVVCGASGKWKGVVGLDVERDELVTVFLQDAVLPPNERWAFMEKHKWRVRMARFKGVPSECLIVRGAPDLAPGCDLTEALGVKKHEKPVPVGMQGDVVGEFPSFIPKTDEPNFQTVPELVARMALDAWHAREKADGTSATAWVDDDGALHVCSRNWGVEGVHCVRHRQCLLAGGAQVRHGAVAARPCVAVRGRRARHSGQPDGAEGR
jgi:hypothetical protein